MIRLTSIRIVAAMLVFTGLGACATKGEPEFGSSVRHMVIGQSYNPAAPVSSAVAATDGEKAGLSVKAYRSEKKTSQPNASALVLPIAQ
jgi:hypothetical protein